MLRGACLGVLGRLWFAQSGCAFSVSGWRRKAYRMFLLPASCPALTSPALNLLLASAGESSQELGPPPSVDEAANTLMTRLGFLLGDKVSEGPAGAQYSMEEPEARQVMVPSATPDVALSSCHVSSCICLHLHRQIKL